jgi:polynucleotide 5'-hydroxyl-kinase GRC3/NOL9
MDVSGTTVAVKAGRALPFEPAQGCTLEVEGGEAWPADPSGAGTSMWQGVAEKVLSIAGRRPVVMLVGRTDTGKSTFSTFLANLAIERGIVPCIIDGDIGQGDLAPPVCVGAAVVESQVTDLRDVVSECFEFVGSTTPAGSERLVARSLRAVLDRNRGLSRLHIINTDGYVDGKGVPYKRMLATVLRPSVVVCLGRSELGAALARGPWLFLRARASAQAAKTRSDRVARRMDQFMRYIGEGLASVPAKRLKFAYRGRPIPIGGVRRLAAPAEMEGMFVGLASRGAIAGFGIIENFGQLVRIRTGVQDFDRVFLSNVSLKNGVESRLF